jgi:hypothetical protein
MLQQSTIGLKLVITVIFSPIFDPSLVWMRLWPFMSCKHYRAMSQLYRLLCGYSRYETMTAVVRKFDVIILGAEAGLRGA